MTLNFRDDFLGQKGRPMCADIQYAILTDCDNLITHYRMHSTHKALCQVSNSVSSCCLLTPAVSLNQLVGTINI